MDIYRLSEVISLYIWMNKILTGIIQNKSTTGVTYMKKDIAYSPALPSVKFLLH